MKQLELHWRWETTVKWSSLMSVVGRLSKPVDCIKHLGYDCVLRSRMDLSLDVSPAVTYLEKSWEEVIIFIIFFHLSCIFFWCCASHTKWCNIWRRQLPIAPTKHWHQNCDGHHLSGLINSALFWLCQGPSLFFSFWTTIYLFIYLFFLLLGVI